MEKFGLDELREIMRSCAGVDDGVDLDGEIADVDFADLGYDSLAVLELASQVQRRYGVPAQDLTDEMATPRRAVEVVNQLLGQAVV